MDPLVQVALISVVATLVTTVGAVVVAFINARKERVNTAESAVERTLRERLLLKEEQIEDYKNDIADRDKKIAERDAVIADRDKKIAERDAVIAERDATIAELRQA